MQQQKVCTICCGNPQVLHCFSVVVCLQLLRCCAKSPSSSSLLPALGLYIQTLFAFTTNQNCVLYRWSIYAELSSRFSLSLYRWLFYAELSATLLYVRPIYVELSSGFPYPYIYSTTKEVSGCSNLWNFKSIRPIFINYVPN